MQLEYPGKADEESVLLDTAPAAAKLISHHGGGAGWRNRLYLGDNLPVLKSLLLDKEVAGRVQVVYIDPPYATNQKFTHRKAADKAAYEDILGGDQFIEFLRRRLIFLRELLAEDGCIYVHLDEKMAFHTKIIMDEVFGESNYRSWITRQKCHSKNYTKNQYGNVADYILFYSKSGSMKWRKPYEQENKYTFEQRFPRVDPKSGRRYALVPIYAPGVRNGETGREWRGMFPPEGKHWQPKPSELDRLEAAGEIYWSPSGNPRRIIWADNDKGVPVTDIWTKFMDFRNQNMKETGYPTEKNAALLKRIIEASSAPGDLVLDCFCGSGTTLAVARDLGRRWIGVDSSPLAIEISEKRLLSRAKHEPLKSEQLLLFDKHDGNGTPIPRFENFAIYKARTQATALSLVH